MTRCPVCHEELDEPDRRCRHCKDDDMRDDANEARYNDEPEDEEEAE